MTTCLSSHKPSRQDEQYMPGTLGKVRTNLKMKFFCWLQHRDKTVVGRSTKIYLSTLCWQLRCQENLPRHLGCMLKESHRNSSNQYDLMILMSLYLLMYSNVFTIYIYKIVICLNIYKHVYTFKSYS